MRSRVSWVGAAPRKVSRCASSLAPGGRAHPTEGVPSRRPHRRLPWGRLRGSRYQRPYLSRRGMCTKGLASRGTFDQSADCELSNLIFLNFVHRRHGEKSWSPESCERTSPWCGPSGLGVANTSAPLLMSPRCSCRANENTQGSDGVRLGALFAPLSLPCCALEVDPHVGVRCSRRLQSTTNHSNTTHKLFAQLPPS